MSAGGLSNSRYGSKISSGNVSTRREVLRGTLGALLSSLLLRPGTSFADPGLLNLGRNLARLQPQQTPIKTQAVHDYQMSVARFGGSLASPPQALQATCQRDELIDVLIIGSGYGGAICAARLASQLQPGRRVVVLERGREWVPGTFPDTLNQLLKESRYGLFGPSRQRLRNPLGLFNLTFDDEVYVMSGSGLGGGSLINAGVAAVPDPEVFQQPCWPVDLRELGHLEPYYQRAAQVLNLQAIQTDTPKTLALRKLGSCLGGRGHVEPALVAVNYLGRGLDLERRNPQGMVQRPCELCGDCTTGCNYGAKNTLPMNYLPWARSCGAELYTQTDVDSIERTADGYLVHFRHYLPEDGQLHERQGGLRARIVILAGGSLGTTGILLRSDRGSLSFSHCLGEHWSGNGDVYGFVVGAERDTNVAGQGAHWESRPPIGVAQQMHLKLTAQELHQRMLIQEGSVPRAFSNALGGLLADLDLDQSLPLFAVGHDGANGHVVLRDGRPAVVWPDRPNSGYSQFAHGQLSNLAHQAGARYRKPEMLGNKTITVHPIGGCPMGDQVELGVTNSWGQVYAAQGCSSDATYPGLYVADGALIPTSLGANPYFTICALAERVAEGIISEPRWRALFKPPAT